MRTAFVNQPWARALPPSESVSIWHDEVGRRLAPQDGRAIAIWSREGPPTPPPAHVEGVEHRFVTASNDWRALKVLEPLWGRRAARRPLFASPVFHGAYARAIARDARRWGADVVHVPNFPQHAAVMAEANPDAAVVLHMHCEWLSQLDPGVVRRRLAGVAAVVACSDHVREGIVAHHPWLADRCRVIANGVDLARFAPAAEAVADPTVLFVGRLSAEKGLHVLARAWDDVVRRVPEARLRIVGPDAPTPPAMLADLSSDPMVRDLRQQPTKGYAAAVLDSLSPAVRSTVEVVGPLGHDELATEYRGAAVVVVPSISESFGMPAVEAMASALPVVASDVGGLPGIVEDGGTGILVPRGDAAALAAALAGLLADPATARRMGVAGRVHVERYGWDHVAAQTAQCHRDAVDRARVRA